MCCASCSSGEWIKQKTFLPGTERVRYTRNHQLHRHCSVVLETQVVVQHHPLEHAWLSRIGSVEMCLCLVHQETVSPTQSTCSLLSEHITSRRLSEPMDASGSSGTVDFTARRLLEPMYTAASSGTVDFADDHLFEPIDTSVSSGTADLSTCRH